MTLADALLSVAVAAGAGALIGAEREQARASHGTRDFGGVRTFPLIATLGAMAGLLAPFAGNWLTLALLVAVVAVLAISQLKNPSSDLGVSSEVAAVVTFVLGLIAATPELLPNQPRFLLVFGIAAGTMALLALKRPLHDFVAKVSSEDVYATVKFVLLAVVVIPLLPDRSYGPYAVLNPQKIGLMVALVAGVSFAGYVVLRVSTGRRGLLLTGIIGGVVSSTALTLALSGRAREEPKLARIYAVAIVAACSTMFARILVIVSIVESSLLGALILPLGAMAIAGGAIVVLGYRRLGKPNPEHQVTLRNPFELRHALWFGLLYAAVLFVAKAAEAELGARGVYGSALLAGLADVDAITLSLAELHRSGKDAGAAGPGITLAVFTNTLVKAALSAIVGGATLGKRVAFELVLVLAVGAAALGVSFVLAP